MTILNVTTNWFRNEAISKTFLFSDDTSIDVDNDDNSVSDMDGMMVAHESKVVLIEKKMNIKIVR